MNISKSESYNLSPDEYLKRFEKPHSVISSNGNEQNYQAEIALLEEQILKQYNDKTDTLDDKENAVTTLKQIVEKWMKHVFEQSKNDPEKIFEVSFDELTELGYGLKVFGSFSLRTNSIDSDIDMICIVPDFFSREKHFCLLLAEQLKKNPNIEMVYAIPQANVPLIKLCLNSVQIDLLAARIPVSILREYPKFLSGEDHENLKFMDDKELRSINGYRTSLYLKKNIKNYKNYQVVLKAIKMWAMNKGIYSQLFGYLGGAALSIMLAKICQLYPKYSPLQLLDRFFFIYANWVWTMPVVIQNYCLEEQTEGGMLIFTPLKPQVNTVHYISRIICHVTRKYLRLASKVIQDINKKKKDWNDLFKPIDFFNTYCNFIEWTIMGQKQEDFIMWKGNIESKLRKFFKFLQNQIDNLQLIEIHPYPRHFRAKHSQYKYCYKYYLGLKCESNPNLNDYCELDITPSVRQFLELLEGYHGIDKVPKQLNIAFAIVERRQIQEEIVQGLRNY